MIWILFVSIIGFLLLLGFGLDKRNKRKRYHDENHPNSQAHIHQTADKEAESRTTKNFNNF